MEENMTRVEIWIAVDERGDCTIAENEDDLELGNLEGKCTRVVCLEALIARPAHTAVTATVPIGAAGEVKVTVS